MTTIDPLAAFLSDPESHLSDILYVNFRIYKKRLMWRFMQYTMPKLKVQSSETLSIADIGASQGFDVLYLLRKVTQNFREPLRQSKIVWSRLRARETHV